jgi:Flp pilus assembly protein TadB
VIGALGAAIAAGACIVLGGAALGKTDRRGLFLLVGSAPGPADTASSPEASPWSLRRKIRRHPRVLRALGGALGGGLGLVLAGWPGGMLGLAGGIMALGLIRGPGERRRRERLDDQLADAMAGMAAALRAGLSLAQALRFAAEEAESPLSESLGQIADRESMGVPLDTAIERWAQSESSPDVRLAASVLQIHHRVGGDTPVVLDQVVRSLRVRRAAAREVRSLTAQARLSGTILGLLPVGFFLFMSIVSHRDIQTAYRSPAGLVSILLGMTLDGCAFLWIRKLLRMEP